MKKLLLVFGALVLALGVFAEDKGEVRDSIQCREVSAPRGGFADEFDELEYILLETAPKGCYVRPAKPYRIIFLNVVFNCSKSPSSAAELADAKRRLVADLKESPRVPDLIKRNDIRLFVNYVDLERMIFTIIVTPEDL